MPAARTDVGGAAAIWRGALVGACSAAVAVGAHGAAGGQLPGGAAIAVLIVACGVVGTAATGPRSRSAIALVGYLCVGQVIGHIVLSVAAGHLHGVAAAPAMIGSHLAAAALCALLITAAERLWLALAGQVVRLVRWLTAVLGESDVDRCPGWRHHHFTIQMLPWCASAIRGPPAFPAV